MSKEVIIKVRDDLDGSDAVETIEFAVRGIGYEIDLSAANVELFEKSVEQFVDAARPRQMPIVGAALSSTRVPPTDKKILRARRKEIRGWASRNGWPQLSGEPSKGRVPYNAIEAYQLTHPEVELPPEILPPNRTVKPPKGGDLESVTAQQMLSYNGAVADVIVVDDEPEPEPESVSPQARVYQATRREQHALFGDRVDRLTQEQRSEIRKWAKDKGLEQSINRPLNTEVLKAYFAAHKEGK